MAAQTVVDAPAERWPGIMAGVAAAVGRRDAVRGGRPSRRR
jgi:hypothetical protein